MIFKVKQIVDLPKQKIWNARNEHNINMVKKEGNSIRLRIDICDG